MVQGIIFDLDGVVVSTDEYHFRAWMELAPVSESAFFPAG